MNLYNTYTQIPIKEYDKLRDLANANEAKINLLAEKKYHEKKNNYSDKIKISFYRKDGDDISFFADVYHYKPISKNLEHLETQFQYLIEELIDEAYRGFNPRKVYGMNEELNKKATMYLRFAFTSIIINIVMLIGLIIK